MPVIYVAKYSVINNIQLCMFKCSNFDKNFGSGGGTISLIYFSGNFSGVTFSNHQGPVVRVRNRVNSCN